jgi:hypothetical protein
MSTASIAERFLLDQIPFSIQRLIPPKLKLAYQAVDQLVKDTPMLQIPSADDNRGRLVSWAVDFAIKGLIESGEWPVDYRWELFAKPTGRYLEVKLPHATLSISQVRFWQEQPRDVVFRENARLGNQQMDFWKDEDGDAAVSGTPSFLLVHGHQDLQFAHVGVPNKHHQRGYVYQTPNLLRLLHEVAPIDVAPAEPPANLDALLSLKAEIERWQRDNGET